jgi:peptidoglycan/LPS O-acetylase OafA/YrhL
MNASTSSDRFHSLDATRAFALLLGVIFHAAWSFVPAPTGAPAVDMSGNRFFDWFFFTSHTFRMQLFFLIAGFFAHMVCHRKGFAYFAKNRFGRIVVPLILGWLILFPLIRAAWHTGANLTDRNLTEVPLSTLFTNLYQKGLMWVPKDSGGMFSFGHLWFLYYLLWLYVLIIGLRWLLTRSASASERMRGFADGLVRRAMVSPWSLVWLAEGTGLLLWPMGEWFGVDTHVVSLVPSRAVLLAYGAFFAFGWLLHRQAGLLFKTARHWRWQLPLAIALSIPLFAVFKSIRDRGLGSDSYPALTAAQITDWPAFIDRLKAAEHPAEVPVELANLWRHIPAGNQKKILALSGDADPDQRAGVSQVIGKLLSQPAMVQAEAIRAGFKPSRDESDRALEHNRAKLQQLFPGMLAGNPNLLGWYLPAKLAFSAGYGLVMWLLIFGTLGFFQEKCAGHSPAWRYVADSSYWIYLAHLPLIAAMQIWMRDWPWSGGFKFVFLNGTAFGILFASYHLMVRSTLIGRLLNGRAYPFAFSRSGKAAA